MAGVRTTHPQYDAFAEKWKRTRDVIAGQDAIHKAGPTYLPRLKDEDDTDYKARVKRSDFFNATWRTIDALSGMAFRKPPTFKVPASIESYLDDINMAGLTMESLAKECVEEVLGPGRIGVLIDHPPQQLDAEGKVVPITQAAAQTMGLRPTLQLYTAESIRNWKYARVNNAWKLVMVVLGEKANEPDPDDEFGEVTEDRYRVLDLVNGVYRQRVFKVVKEEDVLLSEFVPLMNGKPLDFIPFIAIDPNGKGDECDEPPLIDLVDKNVAHYQVNADYRHGLHFTGLPTAVVSGYDNPNNEKLYIGSTSAWIFTDPNAKASYLEFSGQGLSAIKDALDRLEKQMARLGAATIVDGQAQVTATANVLDRQAEQSVLAKIVQSVSEALEWALGVFAQWAGADAEITYQINRDFMPAGMDAQTLQALLAARIANELTEREFFEQLQRGDVISGEKTFEQHQEEKNAEGPPAPAMPNPGVQPGAAAA